METALVVSSVIVSFSIVFAAMIVAFGERRPANPVGRYRVFQAGEETCFLLDTKTGRLWERKAGSPAWSENADVPWVATPARRKAP
ncbi:MAG TPA: hypothetical protein VG013_24540 [Gemmataceae bacterium]|jgi:hypothetical protein|nr:hypothetical protein [Gemmataceae bacterium]